MDFTAPCQDGFPLPPPLAVLEVLLGGLHPERSPYLKGTDKHKSTRIDR